MSNQARVGVFALVTLIIFIFGFYFLKGTNLFSTKNKYYAVYEKVDGLYKSNPVVINGFKIGTVSKMNINQKTGKVVVEMQTEDDFKIPANSMAVIQSTDLVGSKVVAITLGNAPSMLNNLDTIATQLNPDMIEKLGNSIVPLMSKLTKTVDELDGVVAGVKVMFNPNDPKSTANKLNATMGNLHGLTTNLNTTMASGSLDKSLKNIESFTANLDHNNKKIDDILSNAKVFTDNLKETDIKNTVENAKKAIAEINVLLEAINKGDGTITHLIKDKQMYSNLENATASLDKLLIDVKANPFRYVNVSLFGGKKRDDAYLQKLEKAKQKASFIQ